MKTRFPIRYSVIFLAALAGLLLSGCATPPAAEPRSEQAAPETEPAYVAPPSDRYGMEIALDGSSLEAWERSLVSVRTHATPEDYNVLTSAIEYLLMFDLGARRDMATLAKRLDGLNGYQVVDRVHRMRAPNRPRSPAPSAAEGDGTPRR